MALAKQNVEISSDEEEEEEEPEYARYKYDEES